MEPTIYCIDHTDEIGALHVEPDVKSIRVEGATASEFSDCCVVVFETEAVDHLFVIWYN